MKIIYDFETYPNAFTASFADVNSNDRWYYEISERRNDLYELVQFLLILERNNCRLVGYNNLYFDYPIKHFILSFYAGWMSLGYQAITSIIYGKVQEIFSSRDRFSHQIWQPRIRQIDLYKMHHFDNVAKSQSLKGLEFNMRSLNISDLPYKPGTYLTIEQLPILAKYNMHDVMETKKFFFHSIDMLEFRDKLTEKYGIDFTNLNDTKIGTRYFIMKLEENNPNACFYKDNSGKRQIRQTSRPNGVNLGEVILPYVRFNNPEFSRIHHWISQQHLTSKDVEDMDVNTTVDVNTKGVFKGIECTINDLTYKFGTGGIHGSIKKTAFHSDEKNIIIDVDVKSYYPNIGIKNKLFPEHLGELFCSIYEDLYIQRSNYPKKSAENTMLKYALNGTYGNSKSIYSPFFDPKYTMAITINGQLLLCMLAEYYLSIPNIKIIQINTDGLTVRLPRQFIDNLYGLSKTWELLTGLELEYVNYQSMYIRDVNNYIAVGEDGKIKTKGDYENDLPQNRVPLGWHQDTSALIVNKAAVEALVNKVDIDTYIRSPERDIMDFMILGKVDRKSKIILDTDGFITEQQRITRYVVARHGGYLFKISPPPEKFTAGWYKKANGVSDDVYFEYHKRYGNIWCEGIHTKNRSTYSERKSGITKGHKVQVCNSFLDMDFTNINFDYYVAEARKLVDCIKDYV